MKVFKKLMSVLLAAALMASLFVMPAMAAGEPLTITITNEDATAHNYSAYQIFVGDLESTTGALSNVKWGSGVDGDLLMTELKKGTEANVGGVSKYPLFAKEGVNVFKDVQTVGDIYTILSGWAYNETDIRAFADLLGNGGFLTTTKFDSGAPTSGVYTINIPAPGAGEKNTGYYFIKDTGALGSSGATDYLLQVVKTISIRPKVSQPTFSKTVNKSKDGTYNKAIAAQVGDEVWFKLETKLPGSFNNYNAYHLHFQDILPAGLEPVTGSGDMYLQHANTQKTPLSRNNNTVVNVVSTPDSPVAGKTTILIDFMDLKKTLEDFDIDISENDTLVVKYKAVVTEEAVYGKGGDTLFGNSNVATMGYSNDMNQPAGLAEGDTSHGIMTDSASVYVYQAQLKKVDSVTGAELSGAEFNLYRNYSIDQSGHTEKRYAQLEEVGAQSHIYQITGWATTPGAVTAVSGADGLFTIRGLDSITYYLEEEISPVGYTEMKEPVPVAISAEYEGQDIKTLGGAVDSVVAYSVDKTSGTVSGNVKNAPASALPATGGMGTTIFYLAGAILVFGSATAFVVKKRSQV